MGSRSEFTLCRIKMKEKYSYYAMFRDPYTGKRGTKKSVDKLKQKLQLGFEKVTRRDKAAIIAQKALDENIIFNSTKNLSLNEFLLDFFDIHKSSYFKRRLMLDKDSVSPDYVSTRRNLIKNHIIPIIDSNYQVSLVNLVFLEELQTTLVNNKKLSPTTINQTMGSISQSLEYAKKIGLLKKTTITKVDPISTLTKVRGILTKEETNKLMAYLKEDKNKRIYLSCYLSLMTGMRSGEIRALKVKNLSDNLIRVESAYANIGGFKKPKGKKTRIVPCTNELITQLKEFASSNPYLNKSNELIFWSARGGNVVSSHYFSTKLKESLIKSGTLSINEIENRNISFHSLRHMANTLLRGSVDEYILRLTIGHSSEQLSDIYSHVEENALTSLRMAQKNKILPFIEIE